MRIIQLAAEPLPVNINSKTRWLIVDALGTNTTSLHNLIYPHKIFLPNKTKLNAGYSLLRFAIKAENR